MDDEWARAPPPSGASALRPGIVTTLQGIEMASNLPNLRRLFVEGRTDAEESAYSRKAFYNLALFMSSIAVFSLVAQRMTFRKVVGS
ncbi:hypothetical protein P153DRAFT_380696 [Dothidotthia symphoricarpi CBS 119687]|uniref:Uncharacterized protein n=1 Tax=Dothidotthia symphoricarpi CBS 119687 TaxID=1392245 RepID=A0A6A6AVA7_9PLEO|nr:uncharacterized protein P153DRAFT_380696 [Dothidotthia symphoricarpi CBS 119687]KAF2134884.1 hypothetical protein P153DRAFT_380696 [Dothidotthia symphoricarpi CBS 119687]